MNIDELKQHRIHYEHFGNTMPLPREVLSEVFALAEQSFVIPAAKPKAVKATEAN